MTIALSTFMLIWFGLFLSPPVQSGRFAKHNALRITRPSGTIAPGGSTNAYAHVQEKGEFRLHKLFALAAGALFFALPADPIILLLMPIAMMAADQFTRGIEAIDFAGHGAEIMAAEAAGETGYRDAEIARMNRDFDKRGDDVEAELDRWRWLARIVFVLGRW